MPAAEELDAVSARFPDAAGQIARRFVSDEAFRAVCKDYVMARAALETFSRRALTEPRPEVLDYRRLVAELEREIAAALDLPLRRCGAIAGALKGRAPAYDRRER